MAILNPLALCDKNIPLHLINSSKGASVPPNTGRSVKLNIDDDSTKRGKSKKKRHSPYLHNDKIQVLSLIAEKKPSNEYKCNEIYSSYPMARDIYRASSGELRAYKKKRQKAMKSVLTLPNVPAPVPKTCTVSDMNDSESYTNDNKKKVKTQRKRAPGPYRKGRIRGRGIGFYDREAQHFLECSSSDLISNKKLYDGDGHKVIKKGCDEASGDVWSVLRNINKFQFNSRPLVSDEDSCSSKMKTKVFSRKYGKKKGRRLIETCRTQEISYVANFEIQSKSSPSPSSSADRVTVIGRKVLQNAVLEKAIARQQVKAPKSKNIYSFNDKNTNAAKMMPTRNSKDTRSLLKNPNQNKNDNSLKINKSKSDTTIRGSTDSSNCIRASDAGLNYRHPGQCENSNESSTEKIAIGGGSKIMTQTIQPDAGGVVPQKLKPRLVTTMPSAATMPKLTAADIKKRLAQLKFPIVILAKDQLSSTLEVLDYDPPQFNGLNDHIWPYMMEWKKKHLGKKSAGPKRMLPIECITSNLRKVSNELCIGKSNKSPDCDATSWKKMKPVRQFKDKMLKLLYKKSTSVAVSQEPELFDIDRVDACTEVDKHLNVVVTEINKAKQKNTFPERNKKFVQRRPEFRPKKVAFREQIDTPRRPEDVKSESEKSRGTVRALNLKFPGKYPWGKAKWASDFIENVMRKITNGTYYTADLKKKLSNLHNTDNTAKHNLLEKPDNTESIGPKEVSLQTFSMDKNKSVNTFSYTVDSQTSYTLVHTDPKELDSIHVPGFDDAPPTLEIQTLSASKIQVKNCVTNVTVQFDVAVPSSKSSSFDLGGKSSASSCVPLSVTKSHTTVYKCSTTILNAALPAELCTVIPKLMVRNIFNSSTSFITTTETESHATISELSGNEANEITGINTNCNIQDQHGPSMGCSGFPWMTYFNSYNPQSNQKIGSQISLKNNVWMTPQNPWAPVWVPPYGRPEYLPLHISPILIKLLNGRFGSLNLIRRMPEYVQRCIVIQRLIKSTQFGDMNLLQLAPQTLMTIFVDPMKSLTYKEATVPTSLSLNQSTQIIPQKPVLVDCKELVVYKQRESRWLPGVGDFTSLLQKMWDYFKFNIHFNIPSSMDRSYHDCNNMAVDMVAGCNQGTEKKMIVTIMNLHINSQYMDSVKEISVTQSCTNAAESPTIKCIEYETDGDKSKKNAARKNRDKIRRKNYFRLYRKCKSTSNICVEKASTPLSKIFTMDEFIQALGAGKTLGSVFDGSSEQKTLACVRQMETWMNDITPRQAMLILMLTNKKDTPNLVRFRPVILQGIAVNRITRATELDMEIEVIERENMKLRQHCEEIMYIPASEENRDSLFEELCWIAKTTASDYQKPFDESSEKMLKDLLGKRKKLNPSYLRVMARYVGLGLLNTPKT